MKLFPHGGEVFEIISRYDDLLALEGRADYEAGDTLALIVPFLLLHEISEANIATLAAGATLTGGAAKLVSWLEYGGWRVFCITTSYEQYAIHITQRLGIFAQNVACTRLPLERFYQSIEKEELELVKQVETDILTMRPVADDDRIRQRLDLFFWQELPRTNLDKLMGEVKPVGGNRKVAALKRFAELHSQPLERWVAVGDSITDARMLEAVDKAGGLAVAFNANEYALPHATAGLASTTIADLAPLFEAWQKGGRRGAEKMLREREKTGGSGDRNNFHWLSGRKNLDEVLAVHKRIRRLVREEAGKLG